MKSLSRSFLGSCECFFNRPAFSKTVMYYAITLFTKQFLFPSTKGLSLTLKRDESTCSFISQLFNSSSPSTIFLRIGAIVINAFNSSVAFTMFSKMEKIRFKHIFLKRFKRIPETPYTSRSIILKTKIIGIITTSSQIREFLFETTEKYFIRLFNSSVIFHTKIADRLRLSAIPVTRLNRVALASIT